MIEDVFLPGIETVIEDVVRVSIDTVIRDGHLQKQILLLLIIHFAKLPFNIPGENAVKKPGCVFAAEMKIGMHLLQLRDSRYQELFFCVLTGIQTGQVFRKRMLCLGKVVIDKLHQELMVLREQLFHADVHRRDVTKTGIFLQTDL